MLYPYLNTERSLVLTHENNAKVANLQCFEVPNADFRVWNKDLYAMIKQEMEAIQREGYDVVLIVGSAF